MKISLCITSWNPKIHWLRKCLDSAGLFDEIIFHLDSESKDETPIDFKAYDKLKLIKHPKHLDSSQGYNLAVEHASGDFICCVCDDDWFDEVNLKVAISHLRKFADSKEGFDILHFPCFVCDAESGKVLSTWGHAEKISYNSIMENNQVTFSSFYRKKVWRELNGYNPKTVISDWDFWTRAAKRKFRFKHIEIPVYYFRYGHNSAQQRQIKEHGFSNIKNEVRKSAEQF